MRSLTGASLLAMLLLPAFATAACPPAEGSAATPLDEAAAALEAAWPADRPLLVGEVHGTRETPRLVGSLVERQSCGRPVLLLVEIPEAEQPLIDVFLRSEGGDLAYRRLLTGEFWRRQEQDGRSSEAVAWLIDRVRELRSRDHRVELVAFAPSGKGDGASYSRRMAGNVRSAITRYPDHRVLVLGGNFHSQVVVAGGTAPDEQPMGVQLGDLRPLSITVFARNGSFWGCDQTQVCAERQMARTASQPDTPLLTMAANPSTARWHGRLILDEFSTAGPAVGDLEARVGSEP